eukprot:scaffold16219_cov102-Isochrysis_galbana.AAC.14
MSTGRVPGALESARVRYLSSCRRAAHLGRFPGLFGLMHAVLEPARADLRTAHLWARWLRADQAGMDPAAAHLRTPIVSCAETVAILI